MNMLLADIPDLEEKIQTISRYSGFARLAEGVIHEVGSPLAITCGNVGIIRELLEQALEADLPPELLKRIGHHLEKIEHSVERMVEITANVRKMAKGFKSVVEEQSGPVDLHETINDVSSVLHGHFRITGIVLELHLAAKASWVNGVHGKLMQVILDLLLNAKEAVEGNRHEKKISVRTENQGDSINLMVQDNGCGIASENAGKIFDLFFSTKPATAHVGLGLVGSRAVIQSFSGELTIESSSTAGTLVRISLVNSEPGNPVQEN